MTGGTKRDEIITSTSANRMLDRVSPIYNESYVGLWIFEAIGREYDKLWAIIQELPDQLFPESATWAIELWEKRYGIIPPATTTLEERRRKILAARSTPSPFSPAALQRFIQQLIRRQSEVVDHIGPYTFGVYITANDSMDTADFDAINAYIKRHKPSHMSFELWFQSTAIITISAETGFWRFQYPMTATASAGELPDYNITSGQGQSAIRASPDEKGYFIDYVPCGSSNSGAAFL